MSRFTVSNVIKMVLALVFSIFVAFYVLLIGVTAKNKKVILEGAVYAVLFAIAFSGSDSMAMLGLGVMGVAAVRTYMLRDLWLPVRGSQVRYVEPAQPFMPPQVMAPPVMPPPVLAPPVLAPQQAYVPPVRPQQASHVSPLRATDNLTASLAWVSSTAKENKFRFPADTYVTILETCQTLDAVIEAETRQRSGDASFEYELGSLVRVYLPGVLKSYLAIPAGMVNNKQPNGRTPSEELAEQLELLSGQAEALHASRYGETSAELSSMGNFLRERFGHRQKDGFDFGIE